MTNKKLFTLSDLCLSDFAKELGLTHHQTSSYVNQVKHMNFNEFINSFRVEYACQKLKQKALNTYTVDYLATECGFNSKSSFYAAFKKFTGKTPTEFIKPL